VNLIKKVINKLYRTRRCPHCGKTYKSVFPAKYCGYREYEVRKEIKEKLVALDKHKKQLKELGQENKELKKYIEKYTKTTSETIGQSYKTIDELIKENDKLKDKLKQAVTAERERVVGIVDDRIKILERFVDRYDNEKGVMLMIKRDINVSINNKNMTVQTKNRFWGCFVFLVCAVSILIFKEFTIFSDNINYFNKGSDTNV